MKIIIVGASGTIGKKVVEALKTDHEIVTAGSKSGDLQVDITSPESIEAFYKQVGSFDALISTTGSGHFGLIKDATPADYKKGIENKLLGQVNLVLIGQHYINAKGSFTLTSGLLATEPFLNFSNVTLINGALNAFVKGAAIELEDGVRVNVVSPGVVIDSPHYFPVFPGAVPVTMDRVTAGYVRSIFGGITGQVIDVY
ncbi:short chain dehydrogenase [Mucilaginibacter limnophilus]|uniref:Short chain dehydrogenase n=1 Tax=Mucilaginibacter limnophilus TaxID=1932778 RepID=A0A3S2ULD6_9SPHI|nr:short chain dehydrogenase [Mucilaginibacter limnophilus]RVU00567.1 short chain dehydrogenase [Mucilaginibacter limnophilus]